MGLKPPYHPGFRSPTVMEHEHFIKSDSPMLLKDELSTAPVGSPVLEDNSVEKHASIHNGKGDTNGYTRTSTRNEHVPTSVPLQVEVNGFREANPDPLLSSLASTCLPTPLGQGSNNSSISSSMKGDLPSFSGSKSVMKAPTSGRNAYRPDQPSSSYLPPAVSHSAKKEAEVTKRKVIAEKIAKIKDLKQLSCLVPQCEQHTPVQLAILARSMKDVIPSTMGKYVFNDDEPPKKVLRTAPPPAVIDEDLTDLSDLETDRYKDCSMNMVRWAPEKVRFGGIDARTVVELEEKYESLREHEAMLEKVEAFAFEEKEEECARTRCLLKRAPRKFFMKEDLKKAERIDYSKMEPSTSKDVPFADRLLNPRVALPEVNSIQRRLQGYSALLSFVPSAVVRKSTSVAPWLNRKEIEEERARNGYKRCTIREQRRQKMEEKNQGKANDSSDYEDTDQTDDEYQPKHPVAKKKKRGRPPKEREGRDAPFGVTKIGRRHSVVGPKKYDTSEEYLPDVGIALPQKIDYKEIVIPNWRSLTQEEKDNLEKVGSVPCSHCSDDLLLAVANKHHVQEFMERRRFQAFRDKAARDKAVDREHSVIGSCPSSGQNTPLPAPVPPFDPKTMFPNEPAQPTSTVRPFSPRQFLF